MNLSINAQFRPFTYDELIKPFVQYKEAYEKTEQDYADLAQQTAMWKDIANQENNPEAYAMYQRYSNDLNLLVDSLSNGLNINNRSALLGMKRRYYEDIEPIAKASQKIDELSAEQRKLAANNPNLMFDRDFSTDVSIDQMMSNPNLSYKSVDGNDLYNKGAAISKAMASRITSLNPKMQNQYWEIKQGFGEEAANQFLLDSNAIPELNKALEDLVKSSGASSNIAGRAFEYAKQGAISGMVGNISYQNNRGYESPAEYSKRKLDERRFNMQEEEFTMKKEQYNMQNGKVPYRVDSDGTEHFVNIAANAYWSKSTDGTITEEESPKNGKGTSDSIEVITKRLVPNEAYDGSVLKDPKTGKNYIMKDGVATVATTAELNALSGEKRIKAYLDAHSDNPQPSEVGMFEVGSDNGTMKQLSRESNLKDFEDMYTSIDNTIKSGDEYFIGDPTTDMHKQILKYLKDRGLTLSDIEVISNANRKGYFGNEKILIKTKATKNQSQSQNTQDRSNVLG